jgi:thiol-disulfide isomerase/thioredoxin
MFLSSHSTALYGLICRATEWYNVSRPLVVDDLKERFLLLDFWTLCCINCMHVLPKLAELEARFGDDLVVLGVHSPKFEYERSSKALQAAVMRYGIRHPVLSDAGGALWRQCNVRAWPTLVLVNTNGKIEHIYSGEGHEEKIAETILSLQGATLGHINNHPLPIKLEVEKVAQESALRFPGKIALSGSADASAGKRKFWVSDSGHHRILGISLEGNVTDRIGLGEAGFQDGEGRHAQFNHPQGVMEHRNVLYVADTGNHAVRAVDLVTGMVSTVLGTGKQGFVRNAFNQKATAVAISSPWDLAMHHDDRHLVVAMAGTHQLWLYSLADKTVSVYAGNGQESMEDGPYPFNSLSQPSGLARLGEALYFVDAETSSLRVMKEREITTLIGSGLFDFGLQDGRRKNARMQHPLGLTATEHGIYICDSYNHAIRHYDVGLQQLTTLPIAQGALFEPGGVVHEGDHLYVADTNHHAIQKINLQSLEVQELRIKGV